MQSTPPDVNRCGPGWKWVVVGMLTASIIVDVLAIWSWTPASVALPVQKKDKDAGKKAKKDKKKEGPKILPAGWYSDYDQALVAARKTGKPLLVNIRCER